MWNSWFFKFVVCWNKSLSHYLEKVKGNKSEGKDVLHACTLNSSLQAIKMEFWGWLILQKSSKASHFWEESLETRIGGGDKMYSQWEGEGSKKQGKICAWLWRTSERKEKEWGKLRVSRPASPSHSVQSLQSADLVTSARGGGGGIERGRGRERERRRWRGGSVVAVCGIGTLSGSGRGWDRLNHPWQWSTWLWRSGEKDEGKEARP